MKDLSMKKKRKKENYKYHNSGKYKVSITLQSKT